MDRNGKLHLGNRPEHIRLIQRIRELTGRTRDPEAVRTALQMLVDAADAAQIVEPISAARIRIK